MNLEVYFSLSDSLYNWFQSVRNSENFWLEFPYVNSRKSHVTQEWRNDWFQGVRNSLEIFAGGYLSEVLRYFDDEMVKVEKLISWTWSLNLVFEMTMIWESLNLIGGNYSE